MFKNRGKNSFKILTNNFRLIVISRRKLATAHDKTKSDREGETHQHKQEPRGKDQQNLFKGESVIMQASSWLFQGTVDRFNGITIDSREQKDFNVDFREKIEKCLNHWSQEGRRGIWFKVYTEHVQCLPDLTKYGFEFHHAQKGFAMVYKWLPENETDNVPDYSHTMVGVGAVVINDNNEVLCVSDRYAMIPNSWKLPGGYVETGEYLPDAAIREVREETGIESEFQSLLSIRQSHGGSFGCSDIYVVFVLKPLTDQLQRCEREIAKVCWMPVQEYLQHPNVHETNRKFVRKYEFLKKMNIKMDYEKCKHQILKREYVLFNLEKSDL